MVRYIIKLILKLQSDFKISESSQKCRFLKNKTFWFWLKLWLILPKVGLKTMFMYHDVFV